MDRYLPSMPTIRILLLTPNAAVYRVPSGKWNWANDHSELKYFGSTPVWLNLTWEICHILPARLLYLSLHAMKGRNIGYQVNLRYMPEQILINHVKNVNLLPKFYCKTTFLFAIIILFQKIVFHRLNLPVTS